jgi:hypothetical protein
MPACQWAWIVAAALVLTPARARAEDKKACATAYVQSQVQRHAGHLIASREQLIVCSNECANTLRDDCAGWLHEVEAALPSVVIEAFGPDGHEAIDVRVSCDGTPIASRLTGHALPMDPGPHTCHAEMAGASPFDGPLIVHEGEQHRLWRITFTRSSETAPPGGVSAFRSTPVPAVITAPRPSAESTPARSSTSNARPIPASVWALGAVGVVATGVGVAFEASGLVQHSQLDRCKPSCLPSAVTSDKTTFGVGDVAVGIGIVSLAAAVVVLLLRPGSADGPEPPRRTTRLEAMAYRGGGVLGLEERF